ncbi:MAG: hypothetical protein GC137_08620 [Alphaproteobacteria bacterium]|nr:hypothetical protein [Alphaproteobacteria bacterium]
MKLKSVFLASTLMTACVTSDASFGYNMPAAPRTNAFSPKSDFSERSQQIRSFTLEGGPIVTNHIRFNGDKDSGFNENHGITVAKIHTRDYGNWAFYSLYPNSQDETSFGVGYITDSYVIPIGGLSLELNAAFGLVTGYQDYPVPLVAGEARLVLLKRDNWDIGATMAVMPYYSQGYEDGEETSSGLAFTTPFLSLRAHF